MLTFLENAFLAWLLTTVGVIQFSTASIILNLCCQAPKMVWTWSVDQRWEEKHQHQQQPYFEWLSWGLKVVWLVNSRVYVGLHDFCIERPGLALSWGGTPSIPVIDATSIYLVILASWIRTTFWCNTITINCAILGSGIGGSGDQRRKWEEMEEREREREKCCFCSQNDLKEP